jgi:large subunit ribosomal protein L17
MRHQIDGRKLGRTTSHRNAMFRNMVTSLLDKERIRTTRQKAKELRRIADRMITLGKRGNLHARRQALSFIRDPAVVRKLFDTLAPRYSERSGGYTRILHLPARPGDNADMAFLELVDREGKGKKDAKPESAEKEGRGKSLASRVRRRTKKTEDKAEEKSAASDKKKEKKEKPKKKASSKKPAVKKPKKKES